MTRGQLREHVAGCGECSVDLGTWTGTLCEGAQELADIAGIEVASDTTDWRPRPCPNGCGCRLMRWWKFCPSCGRAIERSNI